MRTSENKPPGAVVGCSEARTHLPELLDRAAGGERITITRRGAPVAMLVPPQVIDRAKVEAAVEAMQAFGKGRTLGGLTIRELIEEGRRY